MGSELLPSAPSYPPVTLRQMPMRALGFIIRRVWAGCMHAGVHASPSSLAARALYSFALCSTPFAAYFCALNLKRLDGLCVPGWTWLHAEWSWGDHEAPEGLEQRLDVSFRALSCHAVVRRRSAKCEVRSIQYLT